MKVGILGTGHMGETHAEQLQKMPGVEIIFLARDPEKSAKFGARFGASPRNSIEDILKDADALDVCLPTDMHLEVGLKAIAHGTPVLMEKPLARSLKDAIALRDAAAKANVPFMVGQVVRYFPEFQSGHKIVTTGGVGKPAAARTRRGGPAPSGTDSWFLDHERSGGVLLDLAIHDFDWLRWVLGEVKCLYSRSVGASTGTGPDYALTTLTFDSGAIAHVESTWMDPSGFRTTFEVAGSGGLIQNDSRSVASIRINTTGGSTLQQPHGHGADPYYLQLEAFLSAVKNKTSVPITAHDGVMALSIALAAVESAKTGEVVIPTRP